MIKEETKNEIIISVVVLILIIIVVFLTSSQNTDCMKSYEDSYIKNCCSNYSDYDHDGFVTFFENNFTKGDFGMMTNPCCCTGFHPNRYTLNCMFKK